MCPIAMSVELGDEEGRTGSYIISRGVYYSEAFTPGVEGKVVLEVEQDRNGLGPHAKVVDNTDDGWATDECYWMPVEQLREEIDNDISIREGPLTQELVSEIEEETA